MAKVSMIQRDKKRAELSKKYEEKYKKLKAIISNKEISLEERFEAQLEISKLPRNSSKVRQRNRCECTGRPRGYYRKFRISRIALRELASLGQLPGVVKSSW